jgi:hypothetical protein
VYLRRPLRRDDANLRLGNPIVESVKPLSRRRRVRSGTVAEDTWDRVVLPVLEAIAGNESRWESEAVSFGELADVAGCTEGGAARNGVTTSRVETTQR